MSTPSPMSNSDIQEKMQQIPQWKVKMDHPQYIIRHWQGSNFRQTFAVMIQIAKLADKLNHHPDWSNNYRKLTIRLRTNDVDGISELDFIMAEKIDSIIHNIHAIPKDASF